MPTLSSTTISTAFATSLNGIKDVAGVAWSAGDLIVMKAFTGDNTITATAPTNANLTFTNRITSNVASRGKFYLWTAVAASSQTGQTIAGTFNSAVEGGYVVSVWTNHGGLGNISTTGSGTTGGPNAALTVASVGSAVDGGWINWNQNNGARTYRTTDLGTATERSYYSTGTFATCASWTNASATATGSKTIGLTAPSCDAWICGGVEILPAGGTDATVTAALADATGDVPAAAPTGDAEVTGQVVDGAGDVPTPSISADAAITVTPARGTGDVPDPQVAAPDATVQGIPAAGSSDIATPGVSASAAVDAGPATGAGDAPAPTADATQSAEADSPIVDGAGDVPTPSVSAGATIVAPPADAAGVLPPINDILSAVVGTGPLSGGGGVMPPAVAGTGSGTVTAVPADAAGDIATPTMSAGASVTAPAADGVGDIQAPSTAGSVSATVSAVPADGVADMLAPVMSSTGRVMPRIDLPTEVVMLDPMTTVKIRPKTMTLKIKQTVDNAVLDSQANLVLING